jgi:hypothetical protein
VKIVAAQFECPAAAIENARLDRANVVQGWRALRSEQLEHRAGVPVLADGNVGRHDPDTVQLAAEVSYPAGPQPGPLTATLTRVGSRAASRTMIVPIAPSELKSRNGPSYGALGNPNVSAACRRVPRVLDSLSSERIPFDPEGKWIARYSGHVAHDRCVAVGVAWPALTVDKGWCPESCPELGRNNPSKPDATRPNLQQTRANALQTGNS